MIMENVTTIIKMVESLPSSAQEKVIEHLREYITELQDQLAWDNSFNKTQTKLVEMAKKAKQEIAEGKSQPMNYEQL